jgi:hypothetical protein
VADWTEEHRRYQADLTARAEERVRVSQARMAAAQRLLERARETARLFDELHPRGSPEPD